MNLVLWCAFGVAAVTPASKSSQPSDQPKAFQKAVPIDQQANKGRALIQNIKLDDYLKNVGPTDIVEKMDSQGKGDPDIFIVFDKKDDGSKQLKMQLFDLNRDKKIDMVKHFQKGKLIRVETDLDYDGMVDVVSEYDPETKELRRKIQADGSTNIWKYYFKNELRRKEIDRNSDGKPDMWVYYRNGKVTRTEIDQNFDGRSIRVEGPLNINNAPKAATIGD